MINPNICKLVTVTVNEDITPKNDFKHTNATYQGVNMIVHLRDRELIKAGRRRLYLKYSMTSDQYYLSDRA